MRKTFIDYHDAKVYAEAVANEMNGHVDVGIERIKEYGKTKFLVMLLPKPEKSFGFELRIERVVATKIVS